MKQLTVRNVTPALARALEKERRVQRKSTNQIVLDVLHRAFGLAPESPFDNGIGKLAGGWSEQEAAEFAQQTEIFEQIDEELWR